MRMICPANGLMRQFSPFCSTEGYKLYCGDFFDLTAPELSGVSAYYDRGALVALPPEMRVRYVDHLSVSAVVR